jgi:hypothetical protein
MVMSAAHEVIEHLDIPEAKITRRFGVTRAEL